VGHVEIEQDQVRALGPLPGWPPIKVVEELLTAGDKPQIDRSAGGLERFLQQDAIAWIVFGDQDYR
jgi:hypothetical protein